jgi:putative membrane protein
MGNVFKPDILFNSLVYSLLGVVMFWLAFIIIDKITPYDLWGEIVEKRNMALAIVVAAMCLSIAVIVAASIHG